MQLDCVDLKLNRYKRQLEVRIGKQIDKNEGQLIE